MLFYGNGYLTILFGGVAGVARAVRMSEGREDDGKNESERESEV